MPTVAVAVAVAVAVCVKERVDVAERVNAMLIDIEPLVVDEGDARLEAEGEAEDDDEVVPQPDAEGEVVTVMDAEPQAHTVAVKDAHCDSWEERCESTSL